MIALDLSKQQGLDADPRAIQQINFTANLNRAGNTTMSFIIFGSNRNCFGLFTRNRKSFVNAISLNVKCNLIFYQYKNDTIQQFKCKAIKFTA